MTSKIKESHLASRLFTLAISFLVALVSGTSYLYGVYSPQLITRVGLRTSDSATISLATALGGGIGGLPAGFIIDHEGPRISILIGAVSVFCGYYGLYRCYDEKISNLAVISIAMVFVGFGSIISFYSTLKTVQSNFPLHRGAAGAIPISAYGLSATVFSIIAAAYFPLDTGNFLKFLAILCGSTLLISCFFIKLYVDVEVEENYEEIDEENAISASTYSESSSLLNLPQKNPTKMVRTLSRDRLDSLRGSISFWGTGSRTPRTSTSSVTSVPNIVQKLRLQNSEGNSHSSPFISRNNSDNNVDNPVANMKKLQIAMDLSKNISKRKPLDVIYELLSTRIFLLHFLLLSFASGVGQMYIYSVGFIVKSQTEYKDKEIINIVSNAELHKSAAALQALQVSVISLASFSGRLFGGFLSDLIHKKYHIQRLWIILFTMVLLCSGQALAIYNVNNPTLVTLTSGIIGGSYGIIFGVYPAVIADQFGSSTFSTTWGLLCTGPVLILFILNKYFGIIYDSHTDTDGICALGNACYKGAFQLSFGLCFFLFGLNLTIIYLQRKK